jgi:patatin-like phospholipase/acyl hydrolase
MIQSGSARDWPEDLSDEDNGCYSHVCTSCNNVFTGHKRRPNTCKACANAAKAIWDELSPEERSALMAKNEEEFAQIMAEHRSRSIPI